MSANIWLAFLMKIQNKDKEDMGKLRLAILDMYDGYENQGMRAIKEIVERFSDDLSYEVFDVRGKNELPSFEFDLFISTGGPGSPLDGDGVWDKNYFDFLDKIWDYNQSYPEDAKHLFLICHSFQMASLHFGLGTICKRNSTAFGTFPCWKTDAGKKDPFLKDLNSPFYIADFRDYQFIRPNKKRFKELGASILCLEKKRPHIPFERAVMSVRLSDTIFGTQFHPEADRIGMLKHFSDPERKAHVVKEHGEEKYLQMISDLNDPKKIAKTNHTIIPNFIQHAINAKRLALV